MRNYYYYIVALIVLIIDFVTKKIIATTMAIDEQISVIGQFFLITSHRNRGAAFGILQEQRTFFIIITVVVVVGLIWYAQSSKKAGAHARLLTGLGLVLGGAIGNFIDRVRFGEVVDFLKFNFGSYEFPIFNIADSAICIGVGLILLDTLLTGRNESKKSNNGEDRDLIDNEQQSI